MNEFSTAAPSAGELAARVVDVHKDYIFCCQDVDPKTSTGEDCVTIAEKQIDQCSTVLACDGGFTKKDGVVTCT